MSPAPQPEEKHMEQKSSGNVPAKAAAVLLWVAVIVALGYGVTQTALQAATLFTG